MPRFVTHRRQFFIRVNFGAAPSYGWNEQWSEIVSCADPLTCYRGEAAADLLNLFAPISCS
jgi:hypothetical protein